MRILAGVVGVILSVAAVDALRWFSSARPLPVFCTFAVLVILAFCIGLLSLSFGVFSVRIKIMTVVAALLLVVGLYLARSFCFAGMTLACEHGRGVATRQQARTLVLDTLVSGEDKSPKTRDMWGGQYHMKKLSDETILIWSDGPDQKNGNAEKQIGRKFFAFERTFDPCFPEPYASWQELLRRMTIWEITHVWGCFDGDIIWRWSGDGVVLIK